MVRMFSLLIGLATVLILSGCGSAPSADVLPLAAQVAVLESAAGPNDFAADIPGSYRYMLLESPSMNSQALVQAETARLKQASWRGLSSFIGVTTRRNPVDPINVRATAGQIYSQTYATAPDGKFNVQLQPLPTRFTLTQAAGGTPIHVFSSLASQAGHVGLCFVVISHGRAPSFSFSTRPTGAEVIR